jgi:hypothetical protein
MKRKFIVTHAGPDLDAVFSIWLIKRFWSGWEQAETLFVPAGETFESFKEQDPSVFSSIDSKNSEIVHVDTGFGDFDHHQTNDDTCASRLVFEMSIQGNAGRQFTFDKHSYTIRKANDEVLERMTSFANDIDHFREVYYPEANNDRYQFLLSGILDGLNLMYNTTGSGGLQVVSFGITALDGIYRLMQNKIGAEKEIEQEKARIIKTSVGLAIGFETSNDEVLDISQKNGYVIAVRKDPKKDYIRIKALPEKKIDLTGVYSELKKIDSNATWFLHASKAMVLNGSTKNPKMRPTSLSLDEIMDVINKKFT